MVEKENQNPIAEILTPENVSGPASSVDVRFKAFWKAYLPVCLPSQKNEKQCLAIAEDIFSKTFNLNILLLCKAVSCCAGDLLNATVTPVLATVMKHYNALAEQLPLSDPAHDQPLSDPFVDKSCIKGEAEFLHSLIAARSKEDYCGVRGRNDIPNLAACLADLGDETLSRMEKSNEKYAEISAKKEAKKEKVNEKKGVNHES